MWCFPQVIVIFMATEMLPKNSPLGFLNPGLTLNIIPANSSSMENHHAIHGKTRYFCGHFLCRKLYCMPFLWLFLSVKNFGWAIFPCSKVLTLPEGIPYGYIKLRHITNIYIEYLWICIYIVISISM